LIPAGSVDCAILFLQNLIIEDGILSQLVDNRADFLHDREPAQVEKAVVGLKVESVPTEDGGKTYRIMAGHPTWEGQNIDTCQLQINDWGLSSFLREAQHEVSNADGYFFDVEQLNYIDAHEVPAGLRYCRAWDLAATQGGGDHTAGPKVGIAANGNVYVTDLVYGQWASDNVESEIEKAARADGPNVILRLPQDPAQAGKYQKVQLSIKFKAYNPKFELPSGDKATRARGFQGAVNKGIVYVVRAAWNPVMKNELRKFREDGTQASDDIVDGLSDGYNELSQAPTTYKVRIG
jgi:predicted phage terminase large subunit-like protein